MTTLSLDDLNNRKSALTKDIDSVKEALAKLDQERNNLVAQHHALNGALQQVELFLNDLSGVGGDADSSIPSEEGSKEK